MKVEARSSTTWNDSDALRRIVAWHLMQGSLLLCLGAGVSKFANLPSWSDLLCRCCPTTDEFRRICNGFKNPYEQAQLIRTSLYDDNRKLFLEAIHKSLYEQSNVTAPSDAFDDKGMQALSFLCARSIRGGCNSVVTYNFDDLVEKIFDHSGMVSRSIVEPYYLRQVADVNVFHPHGFLPENAIVDESTHLVICKDDFSRKVNSDWTDVLQNLYATHFPLLIGLSGDDEALLKNLDESKQKNPTHTSYKWPYSGLALIIGPGNDDALEKAGVKVLRLDSPSDWPVFVADICRLAANEHDIGGY